MRIFPATDMEVGYNPDSFTPEEMASLLPGTSRASRSDEHEQVLTCLRPVTLDRHEKEAQVCITLKIPAFDASEDAFWNQKMSERWLAAKLMIADTEEAFLDELKRLFRDWITFPGVHQICAFSKNMTFAEYAHKVRELMVNYLTGTSDEARAVELECGLKLREKISVDKDELFLMISVPKPSQNQHIAADLAERFHVTAALRKEAYTEADKTMSRMVGEEAWTEGTISPPMHEGVFFPGHVPYQSKIALSNTNPYQDFSDTVYIRMIYSCIEAKFNLEGMIEQGLINCVFPVHRLSQVNKIAEDCLAFWPDGDIPFLLSHGDHDPMRRDDDLRNYFGSELAFFFHFLTCYTRRLVVVAILGVCLSFTKFLPLHTRRYIQTGFALFTALWAAGFCQEFVRNEKNRTIKWGVRAGENPDAVQKLRSYRREFETFSWDYNKDWLRVKMWRILGSTAVLLIMAFIFSSIGCIQWMRLQAKEHPDDVAMLVKDHVGPLPMVGKIIAGNETDLRNEVRKYRDATASFLITIQIRVLDFAWDHFVRWIVTKENFRTRDAMNNGLIGKLFTVKLFNLMYPYLYIAFLQEYFEGCGDQGCIAILESSLGVLYMTNMAIDLGFAFFQWLLVKYSIDQEIRKVQNTNEAAAVPALRRSFSNVVAQYTYLQVQAKLEDPDLVLDDMLPRVTQFCFICCFSIVWPIMPLWALVSNCILGRFCLWRRLRLFRRNYPVMSSGSGIWVSVMRMSVCIACAVNTAIAVFAMKPLKTMDNKDKFLTFIGMEHCMLLLVLLMFVLVSDTAIGATYCDEENQRWKCLVEEPQQHRRKSANKKTAALRFLSKRHGSTESLMSHLESRRDSQGASPMTQVESRRDCHVHSESHEIGRGWRASDLYTDIQVIAEEDGEKAE